jgi:hypothetical protein
VIPTKLFSALLGAAGLSLLLTAGTQAAPRTAGNAAFGTGPVVQARASEPVVITGAQVPSWSRAAATGLAAPYPSGSLTADGGDGVRSAHNGVLTVPPDARTGVNPDQIAAYRWTGTAWAEVPVQVDQMYPYFLANGHSGFAFYSGTDMELTYAWNPTAHSTGEESWKKVFGGTTLGNAAAPVDTGCNARYQNTDASGATEMAAALVKQPGADFPAVSQPVSTGVLADDYTKAMPSPLNGHLGDQDQIAMMAGDAGLQAPVGTPQPAGTFANNGQAVTVVDPTAATDGSAPVSFIYLFLRPGGSSYNSQNGYVQMTRDANADQWIDRYAFSPSDPEKIGVSNTGYGPNIPGETCQTAFPNDGNITTPNGQARFAKDRQPRDGMTIQTPTYEVDAQGRWLIRQLHVTTSGTTYNYGPNLIGRWKGRAFQSSPNSSVSLVGFEDEQVNWELNSTLLGWKAGPVRAIREIWGADSGTNVTKTEIYYRDAFNFAYHVRVHPIPPDGLYTSWDFRYGVVDTYYNQKNTQGLDINGLNTQNAGEIDQVPVSGQPAFFNTCVPTQDICSAIKNPEEISGKNGSLVFVADITSATSALHPAVVPFYRDDACFDDGTGDAPVQRPYPGDQSTDPNVQNGYVAYWQAHGAPPTTTYSDLKCAPPQPAAPNYQQQNFTSYQTMPFQGAIGEMGLHFFLTGDSDNATLPFPTDELDAEQWTYAVPTAAHANLISAATSGTGQDFGQNVVTPLETVVVPFSAASGPASNTPEAPFVALLPLAALGLAIPAMRRRRRGPRR